jgi:hypothetical protein
VVINEEMATKWKTDNCSGYKYLYIYIYILKCKGQYVGKSKTVFKVRHSNHKQEFKKQVGGLGSLWGCWGCGYDIFSVTLIEQVREKNFEFLAKREL